MGLSPDGQTLAWGARGVSLWRTQPMSEVTNLWTDNYVVSVLAFSRDNQKLAAAGSVQASNQIRICDLATKQLTAVLTDLPYYWGLHGPTIVSLVFSPQGETLAAGGRLGLFKVWNTSTWQEISPDSKPELDKLLEIRSLSFSPDGHLLAIPQGKAVKLLDFRTGSTSSLSLAEDAEEALQVAFSPDGESLAVGTLSGVIKLFKTKTNRKIRSLVGHTEAISSLAFSQDGGSIVSGSSDKSVRVWNVSENSREEVIRGYTNSVLCLALSNNGQLLASGSSDGAIKLWDAASLRELITLGGHKYRIRSLSFSPDSSRLVSTSGDETEEGSPSEPGEVKLWDVTKRTELGTLQGLTNAVRSAAFSSDGSTLAVATSYVAELWDASTRRFPSSLPEQEKNFGERLTAIAFSPDGQTLAVGSYSDSIELWDVPSRRPMVALSGLGGGVECMAFSPDGKLLATGSRDLLVRLWDVRARKLLAAMPGHKALSITSVAFSPDGKTLSSGGADGTVRLWCVAARSEVATLRSDSDKVFSVVFSPDGECLLSANGRGTFGFWRAPSFRETDSALKTKSQ